METKEADGRHTQAIPQHPGPVCAPTRHTGPGWGSAQDQDLAGIRVLCEVGLQPRLGAQPGLELWLGFSVPSEFRSGSGPQPGIRAQPRVRV